MCLLSVGWQSSSKLPFVFAGNRDEYHSRPSAAANWWQDAPEVLGGRDLQAGGSWLGITRDGRFAVVTNQPRVPTPADTPLSRGSLVAEWLMRDSEIPVAELRSSLEQNNARFGGFNLLIGTLTPNANGVMHCLAGGNDGQRLRYTRLSPGVTGLSNCPSDDPWPKLTWLNQELHHLLKRDETEPEKLFALLQRENPVPDATLTGVSTRPFVRGHEYGTRCSTVITVDQAGRCRFLERRFGPGGQPAGESVFEFALQN